MEHDGRSGATPARCTWCIRRWQPQCWWRWWSRHGPLDEGHGLGADEPKLISQSVHLQEVPKVIRVTKTVAIKVPVLYLVKVSSAAWFRLFAANFIHMFFSTRIYYPRVSPAHDGCVIRVPVHTAALYVCQSIWLSRWLHSRSRRFY